MHLEVWLHSLNARNGKACERRIGILKSARCRPYEALIHWLITFFPLFDWEQSFRKLL